jgi:predicted MFS family arabinose efflux permease
MSISHTEQVKQYRLITGSYWVFTLTDGALRMLVLLFFHNLGYSPIEIASLFLLYELFGVLSNLGGGWIASHVGLNRTMQTGLILQIVALIMLLGDTADMTTIYVMVAQALSGIAKDLNKLSAKSSIKGLIREDSQGRLYRWVALLTGSKNTLKGIGFFLGSLLLFSIGFHATLLILICLLSLALCAGWLFLKKDSTNQLKPKFSEIFSKSGGVNRLSAARFFLFGARDVWFVVALPVFLQSQLQWSYWQVGALMACWIIGYGVVQVMAPSLTGRIGKSQPEGSAKPVGGATLETWGTLLSVIPGLMAAGLMSDFVPSFVILAALIPFGFVFAINSSVHSYLIVAYARSDAVSLDVGFYYMANAGGRLVGTILSGVIYQAFGLAACLILSSCMIFVSTRIAKGLTKSQ